MVVLVTGANGQLGQALQSVAGNYPTIDFVFCNSSELNITDLDQCKAVFNQYQPDFCINTAAYTAVDKAESEQEKAFNINVNGAENLALVCKDFDTTLLHVSTDFVFDGKSFVTSSGVEKSYTETDKPNPTGVYGLTKLQGEQAIQNIWKKHFIIRTSWVYSEFGNNFMKTMLRLASERDTLSVVDDQIGTPTYAVDLANILVTITLSPFTQNPNYGIYNFSNEGKCSWYDFAKEIFIQKDIKINLKPIPTTEFPTPANRPAFSVLDKTKIKETFHVDIKNWKDSLKIALQRI